MAKDRTGTRSWKYKYTVILEPAAPLSIWSVFSFIYDFWPRPRNSTISVPAWVKRMGKQLLGKKHFHHRRCSTIRCSLARRSMAKESRDKQVTLVQSGVPRNVVYSRASAKKDGKKTPPATASAFPNEYGEAPMNLVFGGGDSSVEKMIANTDRGLLVTRVWYIREVDPLREGDDRNGPRDGPLPSSKNGKIASAVRNFPLQTPVHSLNSFKTWKPWVRPSAPQRKRPFENGRSRHEG